MDQQNAGTPKHLWIVGILASLWNAVGAFDYSATQLRIESYNSAHACVSNPSATTIASWHVSHQSIEG